VAPRNASLRLRTNAGYVAGDVDGLLMSVTSTEGERVYCPLADDEEEEAPGRGVRSKPRQLLSQPILGMLEEVEREAFQQAVRESERGAATMERKQVGVALHTPIGDPLGVGRRWRQGK
jgi:hypothetical protein